MSEDQVAVFLASLKRCRARPEFFEEFYADFIDSSDEIREKFKDTDFHRQARVLEDSLYVLANAAQGRPGSPAWGDFPRIAERHSHKDLDIRPELYDLWLACLLESVRHNDREFTPEVEAAWRSTLGMGIEYMRAKY
jgi:hemoglobin-like flavoprotein